MGRVTAVAIRGCLCWAKPVASAGLDNDWNAARTDVLRARRSEAAWPRATADQREYLENTVASRAAASRGDSAGFQDAGRCLGNEGHYTDFKSETALRLDVSFVGFDTARRLLRRSSKAKCAGQRGILGFMGDSYAVSCLIAGIFLLVCED